MLRDDFEDYHARGEQEGNIAFMMQQGIVEATAVSDLIDVLAEEASDSIRRTAFRRTLQSVVLAMTEDARRRLRLLAVSTLNFGSSGAEPDREKPSVQGSSECPLYAQSLTQGGVGPEVGAVTLERY